MVMDPQISILVPAYNEEQTLAHAMDSIQHSFSAVDNVPCEIIVCDNNSTDATAEIARSKGAHVVFEPHNQIARARNTAARAARGKWLIFLDADTSLNANVLRKTLESLESGKVGAGGAILTMDGELPWTTRALISTWNRISVVFKWAAGSYLYCHREAWLETGGFDESLYVSEEIRFSRKLKAWCRRKGMAFHIITNPPILTSSRKLRWYTPWQIFKQMLILSVPWAMMKRRHCMLWYARPDERNLEKNSVR